ncbi:IS3 family transposase [bacterium]|nr:IS3 family transposase [bacterium]
MVSSSTKRRAVKFAVDEGMGSSAVACRALGLPRSTYYRISQVSDEAKEMGQEILQLSEKHPRYGYRRITAMMRRDGYVIAPPPTRGNAQRRSGGVEKANP